MTRRVNVHVYPHPPRHRGHGGGWLGAVVFLFLAGLLIKFWFVVLALLLVWFIVWAVRAWPGEHYEPPAARSPEPVKSPDPDPDLAEDTVMRYLPPDVTQTLAHQLSKENHDQPTEETTP